MVNAAIPKLLAGVLTTLSANLSQTETNGASEWGTLGAQKFSKFLTNNPLPDGYPWSTLTATNADPYTQAPATGVVRHYDWTISRKTLAPDGVEKPMIVVNGAFPGPTIEANWGDWIEVTVTNALEDEGTSLHWHGLLQTETPWFDGVPGVQQCPIAPNSTFTYRFRADLYGTSWWHSHYSAQYSSGVLGPMIIHGPSHLDAAEDYDIDLGPVLLTDWYHRAYFDIVEEVMGTDINSIVAAGSSQNNLINGKMNFNCSTTNLPCTEGAGISKFEFTTGKKHRLRLINAGSEGLQKFSIDEHNLTVIAHDFVPIEPYTVNMVSLGIGQRYDVIVDATGSSGSSYFMRSTISTGCTRSSQPYALAAVYYPDANQTVLPNSTPQTDTLPDCTKADYPLESTVPIYKITPAETPDLTYEIEISLGQNSSGNWVWAMSGSSFRVNFNEPVLILANKGNTSFPSNWNVYNSGNATNVRVILKNLFSVGHPMHLHGHNMFELASGTGTWDGTITNPENPARRDTHIIPGSGYYVFQYVADNPGVWPFHCHIAWHVSGGLYVNMLERPDELAQNMKIPQIMHQTCRDWAAFSKTTVIEQIDSGL